MTDTPEVGGFAPLVIGGKAVDGRTMAAKRYKSVVADLVSDIPEPSTGQRLLISRAAGLTVQIEMIEAEIASGKPCIVNEYTQLVSALVRVLGKLGLDRQAKDINPKAPLLDAHARAVIEGNE